MYETHVLYTARFKLLLWSKKTFEFDRRISEERRFLNSMVTRVSLTNQRILTGFDMRLHSTITSDRIRK